MRVRIYVRTRAEMIPWDRVQRPGRGLAYRWLAEVAPELGVLVHEGGAGPYGLAPFGYGPPRFPSAPRRPGVYAAGGRGVVEFGSPAQEIVRAWVVALGDCRVIDWGGVALSVEGFELVEPPDFADGVARFRTVTPVVMKGSGRDEAGQRVTRQAHLLPGDTEFESYFEANLRRKAETVGGGDGVRLVAIRDVGPKRGFAVGGGRRVGATLEAEVAAEPEVLAAIWSWGLGQANSGGFGWIA